MSDEEIRFLLSGVGLNEREQKSILNVADKTTAYTDSLDWQRVVKASRDIYHARLTLRKQRIFMPADLTKQFNDIIEQMEGVHIERRMFLQYHPSNNWLRDCVPIFEEMATHTNRRLFREERKSSVP